MGRLPTRRLGRTGHQSSVAVLGGILFHFLEPHDAESALHEALDAGVNHLDIAPGYGTAEETVGPFLPAVRDRLFLGEKTAETGRDAARRQLEESLRRLHCDRVDLYQLHGLTTLADLDSRAGAVETLLAAREEGLCRWIGSTGHNAETPATQAEAVRRYDLDTVMFPIYPRLWADSDYRRSAESLLELCADRDVGVLAIKVGAARPWPTSLPHEQRPASTWYDPVAAEEVERGVRFALSQPGVTSFCTPGESRLLKPVLEAAARFTPMDAMEQQSAVEQMAAEASIFPIPI
jgi:aryl-alcohol dehydrogenase-like predicted oxidoreductase